jgi:group I intron endonuclease
MKREIICGIYKITSPSRKIYIGQSVDILLRFGVYKRLKFKNQHRLFNSLTKYGVDRHRFEIVHVCEVSELNRLERYYIDLYRTFNNKYGLNLREGGSSVSKMSIESREKMSLSQSKKRGELNSFYGKRHSDETKKHWSTIRKGVPVSEESKKKISASLTNHPRYKDKAWSEACGVRLKKIWSDAGLRKRFSEYRTGEKNPAWKGYLNQIDPVTGNIIKKWDSLTRITTELNVSRSEIYRAVKDNNKIVGGFKWVRELKTLH